MKRVVIVLSALFAALLLAGCSDDDCPDCPVPGVPAGIVNGNIWVNPGAYLDAEIIPLGSVSPALDSMHLGDSLMLLMSHFMAWPRESVGGEVLWEIDFSGETGPTYMYGPGDTAHIDFWGDGRAAACDVVVLDPEAAEANVVSPVSGADTVAPGEPVTIYWNRIQHVQYYGVAISLLDADTDAPFPYELLFDWTADTSYTVAPEVYPDSLAQIGVTVIPFTGPNPTSTGNVTGGWLSGRITSFGLMDFTTILGWAGTSPMRKSAPGGENLLGDMTPAKIIDEIYRRDDR